MWQVVERGPQVHRKWITRLPHKFGGVFKSVLLVGNCSHVLVWFADLVFSIFSPYLKAIQEPTDLDGAKGVGLFE